MRRAWLLRLEAPRTRADAARLRLWGRVSRHAPTASATAGERGERDGASGEVKFFADRIFADGLDP